MYSLLCVTSVFVMSIIVMLFISYIRVQGAACKKTPKYNHAVGRQFNYIVVKYITMSFASHRFIVSQFMVSSRMLINSAMMLASMSLSVFILFF